MRSAMRGEWERKAPNWWTYYRLGRPRPYGNVVCHREDGSAAAAWDAIVTGGATGDETAIVESVPLDEARAALEQHAARQDGGGMGERSEA
jgi:hypothetical protein